MGDRTRFAVALMAAALFCGCQTTDQVKGLVRKTGIRTQTTPDPIAFNQVPDRNKVDAFAAAKALRNPCARLSARRGRTGVIFY